MTRELREYQHKAIDFMQPRPMSGGFIDCGLGKTAIGLHILLNRPKPLILVAPIQVIETVWAQESQLWEKTQGLTFSLVRGSPKDRILAAKRPADVYLVNPELLDSVLPLLPHARGLVIDESSTFKNYKSVRFRTMKRYLKRFEFVHIFTGTPAPNSLLDLWPQIYMLDQGARLGKSFSAYKDRFFEQADYMGFKFRLRPGAADKILELISDLVIRIDAADHLPPRSVLTNEIRINLPPGVLREYKRMEKDAFAKFSETAVTADTAVAALMKLRQMASGFVYDDEQEVVEVHTEKIEALRHIIAETGSPVLVIYQFLHELAAIKAAFPQIVMFKPDKVDPWNRGEIPLMAIHPKSGGHGVNLQDGGHTMAIFSASFSSEEMTQTMARIDRQGQTKPVIFHRIICNETVDELLYEVLENKTHNQMNLLERIKHYAASHYR